MCNERGGIVDDFVVYRMEEEKYMIVYNAANRAKNLKWLTRNAEGFNVEIEEISDDVAMFAVQGPNAEKVLQSISLGDLTEIARFKCAHSRLANVEVFVSRTGYTGEDGFEVFIWDASLAKPEKAVKVWNAILEAGKAFRIMPCGLAARDTLRLEAGMCLYGADIDEKTTPFEAALSFVVKLHKEKFIGMGPLVKQKNEGIKRRRIGIHMAEKSIPRRGYEIYSKEGEKIGHVTSGTFSPLLKCGIGMAYIQTSHAKEGNAIKIQIREKLAEGKIVRFPFFNPAKYGYRRGEQK
jgi:aminomethyltransferase